MQALILAGGEGTRLRPLTSTIAKPVVPLVGRPFLSYMLDWLAGHGVDEAILSCGFLADKIREVLGDGADYGIHLSYLEEPRPLGTGGAVKFAQELLDERFLVLNGDVLTDIDLTAQLESHERTGALLTLALYPVQEASAYGLVRCDPSGAVSEFIEKPGPEHEGRAALINAGAYVVERAVLDAIGPAGNAISIEREVFPALIENGLYGYVASGYWLDIGTPERYLEATYDILDRNVSTAVGDRIGDAGSLVADDVRLDGRMVPPVVVGPGCEIASGAIVERSVLGSRVTVEAGARIEGSVVLDGASVGLETSIGSSIVGPNAMIGDRCRLADAVLGEGVDLGSDSALEPGARIFPGVRLPEGASRS